MEHTKNITRRLWTNRLVYWGICLLAGLTAVPLLAILGEVFICWFAAICLKIKKRELVSWILIGYAYTQSNLDSGCWMPDSETLNL